MGLEKRLECRILPKGVLNMKYCPYCGADLPDGAASFCMECGKSLPIVDDGQKKTEKTARSSKNAKKKGVASSGKPRKKRKTAKVSHEPVADASPPKDDGYDGYYDDVLPPDIGKLKEGVDTELVKKIAAVAGVMLLIVSLCVAAMYLL